MARGWPRLPLIVIFVVAGVHSLAKRLPQPIKRRCRISSQPQQKVTDNLAASGYIRPVGRRAEGAVEDPLSASCAVLTAKLDALEHPASKRNPDERSDIRGQHAVRKIIPHIASLMRATC